MMPRQKEYLRLQARILYSIRGGGSADLREDKAFESLALEIFGYQYRTNAVYRSYCRMLSKSPQRVSSWKQIPALPALAFKEFPVRSYPGSVSGFHFDTSGTTSSKKGRHYFPTLRLYEASVTEAFRFFCHPEGDDFEYFFLIRPPSQAPFSSLSRMMSILNRQFARSEGRFYVDRTVLATGRLLADLRRTSKKVFLFSTAFSLKAFLEKLANAQRPVRLASGSRVFETGGYKGLTREVTRQALYRQCGKWLSISPSRCVSEYGMTELSSQFYNRGISWSREGEVFLGPPWTRTRVIDPRDGQEAPVNQAGILVHFDCANLGSVMALQTEDLGIRREEGFELAGRVPKAGLRGCSITYEGLRHGR